MSRMVLQSLIKTITQTRFKILLFWVSTQQLELTDGYSLLRSYYSISFQIVHRTQKNWSSMICCFHEDTKVSGIRRETPFTDGCWKIVLQSHTTLQNWPMIMWVLNLRALVSNGDHDRLDRCGPGISNTIFHFAACDLQSIFIFGNTINKIKDLYDFHLLYTWGS